MERAVKRRLYDSTRGSACDRWQPSSVRLWLVAVLGLHSGHFEQVLGQFTIGRDGRLDERLDLGGQGRVLADHAFQALQQLGPAAPRGNLHFGSHGRDLAEVALDPLPYATNGIVDLAHASSDAARAGSSLLPELLVTARTGMRHLVEPN